MKKSLLALAALGTFAGVVSAQSSVTLYGTVDMRGMYVKNDGSTRRLSLGTNGINSSQLGFKGIEDLGGGLKAGFELLADLAPIDTGNAAGRFFGRRAVVSLYSPAGELRLGRDYTPSFWNQTVFDAFGTNGVGNSLNVAQAYNGTRQDNSIGYFLPGKIGGLYGQVMVAAGEGGTSGDRPGRYLGARVGFAAGPFNVAVAAAEQEFGLPFGLNLAGDKQITYNAGGSYDFGIFKLLGYYQRDNLERAHEDRFSVSAQVGMGQGQFRVGYDRSKLNRDVGGSTTVDQIKATYQYNLSKRTAIYGTISRLDNKNATRFGVAGGSSITAAPTAGGESKGFDLGVRHFF